MSEEMEKRQKPNSKSDTPQIKEEDVLRRMLNTPPKPQNEKVDKKQSETIVK